MPTVIIQHIPLNLLIIFYYKGSYTTLYRVQYNYYYLICHEKYKPLILLTLIHK